MLLLATACSGYRFTQQENPLSQYGIRSLSVPMFYNYSNLGEVSSDFTRETYRLLMNFGGLKLRSGYDSKADAVLIGIIKSPEKLVDTLRPEGSPIIVQDKTPKAVGSRQKFSVPAASSVNLYLHVIVIKKPTEEELALLKSGIGEQIKPNSRVIFNEILPVRSTFTRELLDENGVDVISTQNAGIQRKVVDNMAEQAAISIRDMILYAF